MLFYPAVALALTVLSFIMMGDAVREALDPRHASERNEQPRPLRQGDGRDRRTSRRPQRGPGLVRRPPGRRAPLLKITDLEVTFTSSTGVVPAVRGANLTIYPGQTVAIVGESGSGKSTTAAAVIGLLPGTGKVAGGTIEFDGQDITNLTHQPVGGAARIRHRPRPPGPHE